MHDRTLQYFNTLQQKEKKSHIINIVCSYSYHISSLER